MYSPFMTGYGYRLFGLPSLKSCKANPKKKAARKRQQQARKKNRK